MNDRGQAMFDTLDAAKGRRCVLFSDPASGLRAIMAIDSLALGPAVGGIRTRRYASELAALRDAVELAAAMTMKCAIAGLNAGGGKIVVLDHDGMDRPAAFRRLGGFIEDMAGLYRAAGDLGTSADDLKAAASATRYVNTRAAALAKSAGQGVLRCVEGCLDAKGERHLSGLRVAVQGCGAMGAAVARALAGAGADLVVADLDATRAKKLADEMGADVVSADGILRADADVFAPCAGGGVLTSGAVEALNAWAVCGAANNQVAEARVHQLMHKRGLIYVPDFLASAGAVIEGEAGPRGCAQPLIDDLRRRTRLVLQESRARNITPDEAARRMARERLAGAERA